VTKVRVKVKGADKIDAQLARMPIELREKHLKKALGKAVRVMAREARRRAPVDADEDDGVRIKNSIRTATKASGTVVRATARVTGLAAVYSVPLEYGHRLFVMGVETEHQVPEKPFWRPAIDTTEPEQHRTVVGHLREESGKLAR
jgi:hypothetical protein